MRWQLPEGSVVKFRHKRNYDKETPLLPLPHGGVTTCTIALPNGEAVAGMSRCRSNENYCKKLGRNISLGRALAQAAKEFPDLFETKEKAKT